MPQPAAPRGSTSPAGTSPSAGRGPGVALVLGSCFSLQFGAALATKLFPVLGPWGVSALRLSLAGVILLALVRPRVRAWSRRQWWAVLLFAFSLAGMNGTFYCAIARIPVGPAVAVEFLGPLVLSACLSRTARDLLWVGVAFAGMGLLGLDSLLSTTTALDPLGVLLAGIAGAFWALYVVCSARVGREVPGQDGLAVAMMLGGLFLLPVGGASAATALTQPAVLGLAALTALLASVIPYSLEMAALRRLPSAVFSILLSLEPVVAAFMGWVLLGQVSGPLRLLAIGLVVAASVGTVLSAPRRTGETSGAAESG